MTEFSISEALEFGWDKAKNNFPLLLSAMLIAVVVSLMPGLFLLFLSQFTENLQLIGWAFSSIVQLFQMIIYSGMALGFIKIVLRLTDNQPTELADLVSCFPLVFNYLVAHLLNSLIVSIGAIFFLVPGIILGIKLQFFGFYIVDKGCGPIEAMQKSWELTKNRKWKLFLLDLVVLLVNVLGFMCMGIGVFVTAIITAMALTYVYRKLEAAGEMAALSPSPIS